ncbi:hypothetical protein BD779DRAFT_1561960, partial [Infundibulicybe gibba]
TKPSFKHRMLSWSVVGVLGVPATDRLGMAGVSNLDRSICLLRVWLGVRLMILPQNQALLASKLF